MTRELLMIILFTVALLAVCWILAEYWLGMKASGHHEEVGRLRFGSRTAFAIPDDTLKHEMGLADNGLPSRDKKADR